MKPLKPRLKLAGSTALKNFGKNWYEERKARKVKTFKRVLAVVVGISTLVIILAIAILSTYFSIPLGQHSSLFTVPASFFITYVACMKVIFPLWDDRKEYKLW